MMRAKPSKLQSQSNISNIYVYIFICTKQRTTALVLFVNDTHMIFLQLEISQNLIDFIAILRPCHIGIKEPWKKLFLHFLFEKTNRQGNVVERHYVRVSFHFCSESNKNHIIISSTEFEQLWMIFITNIYISFPSR